MPSDMQIGDRPKFYWCAAAGLMGVLVTLLFIPEVTDLDSCVKEIGDGSI